MNYRYHYNTTGHRPRPNEDGEATSENQIRINTTINVTQNANANGGDGGNGGDTGETGDIIGGAAASASSTDDFAIAFNSEVETEISDEEDTVAPMGLNNLPEQGPTNGFTGIPRPPEDPPTATADGGDAIGPGGGNGGDGGDGGTAANSASIVSENVIVINTGNSEAPPALTLGLNNRRIDISSDENGNTFVNGQRMVEETLRDGTKVFVFRNNNINTPDNN